MTRQTVPSLAPTSCVVCHKKIASGMACAEHVDVAADMVDSNNAGIPCSQHTSDSMFANNHLMETPLCCK